MANSLLINGTSADQVYQTVLKTGASDSDAKLLVSNWIYQSYIRTGRRFSFATAFPATVPACMPAPFQRAFAHRDWVDGEDLVQAGASANDDGFNARFHRIETDLDALGARISQLADCMADMRSSLRKMLDEVAAELNRIDNDIAPSRSVVVDPVFTGNLVNVANEPKTRPLQLANDPMYRYLGTTVFQNKQVSMFNSTNGVVILPSVDASVSTPSQQLGAVGAVAQAMQENADLKAAFGKATSKEDLIQRFGNVAISNGQTLGDAVAFLPDGAQYANGQALLEDLSSHTATFLQCAEGASSQLALSVNAPAAAGTLGGADVSGLETLTPQATKALKDAGIATIGQLASADPAKISAALGGGGAKLSEGQIAAVSVTAKTLAKVSIRR